MLDLLVCEVVCGDVGGDIYGDMFVVMWLLCGCCYVLVVVGWITAQQSTIWIAILRPTDREGRLLYAQRLVQVGINDF